MAITFVQAHISADNSAAATTIVVSFTAGGTGNLICGCVNWSNDGTHSISSIKDSTGATYNTVDSLRDTVNNESLTSFYLPNISGSPTSITVTFDASLTARVEMQEWSGVATTTPLDGHAIQKQTSASLTISSGNFTPTVNGDLIYGGVKSTSSSGVTFSAGASYTIRNQGSGGAVTVCMADESQIQGTAATIAATFGIDFNGIDCLICGMAFKAATAAAGPTVQTDWPNPYRTTWYQHWQSRFETTPTVLPVNLREQRDWPNPIPYPRLNDYTWFDNGNALVPTVLPTPLRKQVTGPNPQPVIWYQSWTQNSIQSVPAPFSQSNWPLPQPVTWYQSWIDNPNTQLPFPTPFLPQDQSLSPRDLPRLPSYTWTQSFQLTNPFNQLDWPNPQRIVWYQNWSQSLNLFYQSETFPFNQDDWPNPKVLTWDRFWSQSPAQPVAGAPFVQTDWPLAQRIVWYLDPNIQNIIGTTLATVSVEGQFDWQLPPQINPLLQNWTYNQTILMGPTPPPFFQTDWPLPRTYTPIPQSWIEVGNVQIPFPTPFFQNVDANTPVIVRPIDQTWIQSLVNFYQANTFPFSQKDYPNPYPVRWYVDYNQNLVIYLPVGIKPTNQSDWPLTGAPKPIDQFYSQSLALNLPTPPPPLVIFSSGRQLTEKDVLRSWMSAIGDKGRAIRYSQIPNFPG